jgi:hypothetical protein|tara:strand:+ start:127 stop:306 length:180 start_codon:yes stop_codon:yes gene_type:complete
MSILTALYDGLKDNERVKDLGFGVLGGVISIVGTRALGIGVDKDNYDEEEDFEDGIEDD